MHRASTPSPPAALVAAGLTAVTVLSLALRTGAMDAGFWVDEAIAVGIASHDLLDIPATLRQDGSPPLYYLLLHAWMLVAGTGEVATRIPSLVFALLTVPAAWFAGRAVWPARSAPATLAAAGAAGCPFLTAYAQETRMYSLVALLSIVAAAAFVLAFLHRRRAHLVTLGAAVTGLLYTHTWGIFLALGMGIAWLVLVRERRIGVRDGLLVGGAVAVAFLPWLPTVLFQAAHTAAPWAQRPTGLHLLAVPAGIFGYVALPLLAAAVVVSIRRGPGVDPETRSLAVIAVATASVAWIASQIEPAWSPRYLAVVLGPLLLALASTLSRGGTRWTAVALAGVAATWLIAGSPPAKSNARSVSARVGPAIGPGDLVVSTQPEQVPVVHRYLPDAGVAYLTPLGPVADPRLTDWRDALPLLRAGRPERDLLPAIGRLAPGRRVLLVTPAPGRRRSQAPWSRTVRVRTREWRRALRADPRLRPLDRVPATAAFKRDRASVRAELFEVRTAPR